LLPLFPQTITCVPSKRAQEWKGVGGCFLADSCRLVLCFWPPSRRVTGFGFSVVSMRNKATGVAPSTDRSLCLPLFREKFGPCFGGKRARGRGEGREYGGGRPQHTRPYLPLLLLHPHLSLLLLSSSSFLCPHSPQCACTQGKPPSDGAPFAPSQGLAFRWVPFHSPLLRKSLLLSFPSAW